MQATNQGLMGATRSLMMAMVVLLPGCMATKVVTVPVKVAYGTTKVAVKGTAKAVQAVIPGDSDAR